MMRSQKASTRPSSISCRPFPGRVLCRVLMALSGVLVSTSAGVVALSAHSATAEAAGAVSTTCADVTTWAVTVNSTYYFVKSGGGWISSRGPDGSDQFGTVSLSVSQTSFNAVNPYLPSYNGYTATFSGSVSPGCLVTGTWVSTNLGQHGVFSAFPVSRSAPVIDSVEPAAGPLTGGNTVTITGSGFANPNLTLEGVVFDPTSDTSDDYSEGFDAPDVTVVSDTEIDVTAPDATDAAEGAASLETDITAKFEVTGSPGEADDSVPAAQGDNSYVFGAPVIDSVEPAVGPLTGGNDMVITGSGFANPDLTLEGVVFDPTSDTSGDYSEGIDAPDATLLSDTQIDVTVPDATVAAEGATTLETEVTAKFEVTGSPGVTDNSVPADQGDNSYVFGAPVIDSVEPTAGPLTGGNDVVITGSGFDNPDLTFEGVVFDPTSDTSGDYSEGIDAPTPRWSPTPRSTSPPPTPLSRPKAPPLSRPTSPRSLR